MKTPFHKSTLQLSRPFGRVLFLAALLLMVMAGLAEVLARLDAVQARLPAPSLGSGHQNFDLKVARLERFVKKEGGVDCILLGSSTVNYGLDPEAIRRAHRSRTGKEIRCFNFGLAGLNTPMASAMIRILVDRFHPKLVILGIFPGEESFGRAAGQHLMSNLWVNQQLGRRSLSGWLLEHSMAYRYFLRFCIWLKQPAFSRSTRHLEHQTAPDGFTRTTKVMANIDDPPDPVRERELFIRYGHFQIAPSHLAAIDELLAFKSRVELAVVEMPIHPTTMAFFGRGRADYDQAIAETRKRVLQHGVPFWSAAETKIPKEGWWNRNHLNWTGAQVFSVWLEDRMAEAVSRGLLKEPGLVP